MSTAVYYSNHNIPVEDVHASHTLPSLSQIMPINQQQGQQNQENQQSQQAVGNNTEQISPTFVNVPINQGSYLAGNADQKFVYQSQPSPDVFSQNGSASQPSSANTTPASSLSVGSQYGSTTSAPAEKCTCKTNTNRIPRPRNAFILFRQKNHQLVLEEGSVIRTNPDVSRELGRRWRSLSVPEKNHWNKLAEEEKVAHAKKYPGYKYTPRRNGKNKGCPACRQKSLKQQQVQLHNQQMYQLQQGQYQQYMQMQQQQQAASANLQTPIPQNMASSNPNGQPLVNVPLTQFIVPPNPYPQQNFQFAFNNDMNVINQQQLQQQLQQDKASPLSAIPGQTVPTINQANSDFLNPVNASQMQINYDQNPQSARFNSLPTPMGSNYGFEFGNMHQQS